MKRKNGMVMVSFKRARTFPKAMVPYTARVPSRYASARYPLYRQPYPFRRGREMTVGSYGRFGGGPQAELKFRDVPISAPFDSVPEIPATGGQLTSATSGVNWIIGSGPSDRIGRQVIVKSIFITGRITYVPAAAVTAADYAYMVLVQDTQTNGIAATIGDADTGIFTGTDPAAWMRSMPTSKKFRILKFWRVKMISGGGDGTDYNNVVQHIRYFKKCNIPIDFSTAATNGELTGVRSNNIFLVTCSGGLSDDLMTFTGNARLRYTDHH